MAKVRQSKPETWLGSGFCVLCFVLCVSGFVFRVSCFVFHVSFFVFHFSCYEVRASCFELRALGFGFRALGCEFQASAFRLRVSGFGFQVSGFGFRTKALGASIWFRRGLVFKADRLLYHSSPGSRFIKKKNVSGFGLWGGTKAPGASISSSSESSSAARYPIRFRLPCVCVRERASQGESVGER